LQDRLKASVEEAATLKAASDALQRALPGKAGEGGGGGGGGGEEPVFMRGISGQSSEGGGAGGKVSTCMTLKVPSRKESELPITAASKGAKVTVAVASSSR